MHRNALVISIVALAFLATSACKKDKDKEKKAAGGPATPTATTPAPTTPGAVKPGVDQMRRHRDPAARVAMLKARLGLDDDQAKKLEEIYGSGERGKERSDKIKALLKPEQLTKWEEMRASRMGGMRGPGGMGGMRGMRRDPAARAAMMQKRMGLDDEQTKKLTEILKTSPRGKERSEKIKALLEPDQLKKWEADRAKMEAMRKKIEEMRAKRAAGGDKAATPAKPDDKK